LVFFREGISAELAQRLTMILGRAWAGDERARGELIALIYDELRRVASRLMRRERAGHTLPPTAVVHEAVIIRLLGEGVFDRAADRSFVFASAARAMREVLIDHARQRAAARRGGGMRRVPLDSGEARGKPDTHPAAVNRSTAAAAPTAPAHECLRDDALAGNHETTCLARIFGFRARPARESPFFEPAARCRAAPDQR
jgi:RNA polymerase sigma factor (TIGR02999 family)